MEEKVSIIVPVYKAEDYIANTIQMVREQTFTGWELILVDDASGDNSVRTIRDSLHDAQMVSLPENPEEFRLSGGQLEEYCLQGGQRVLLVCKAENEGAAKARNTGMEMARGRYIAFLDADDVWKKEKLEKQLAFMKEKEAGFVFSAYEFGDEKARPTGKIVHVPERLTYRQALSRTVIFTTTVLFDREKIDEKWIYMPDVESEDTATWWQILRTGVIAYGMDEVLAIYRRPAKSLSSNKCKAIKRIWNLYRRQEKLSVIASACYFVFWAYRATVRRL